ncbi:MAG: amidohydrolase family protein [Bryobacteraceae bacterium]
MNTPWGEIEVADAHVHFFSHRFFSLLATQKRAGLGDVEKALGWPMPPERPEDLAAIWAAELDRHAVSRAVLIASLPGDMASVAAAVTAHPDRFDGFFFVDPTAQGAVAAVHAGLAAGLRGICLFPAMHAYPIAGPRAIAAIQAASEHPGTIVFVHCGALSVGVRNKLGLPSPFELRYSNPMDLHSIAQRFAGTPFVIPHFGAGLFREALMVADLCPNVYLDTSSTNGWMRYQSPAVTLRDVYARALDVVGPRRLLFGTDSSFFPRGWHSAVYSAQVEALAQAGADADAARAVLGGNLRRVLGSPSGD